MSSKKKTVKAKPVIVIDESDTGRNRKFKDTNTGDEMTRAGFVKKINKGDYEGYHVRKVNGLNTPVSNPDCSTSDNLG